MNFSSMPTSCNIVLSSKVSVQGAVGYVVVGMVHQRLLDWHGPCMLLCCCLLGHNYQHTSIVILVHSSHTGLDHPSSSSSSSLAGWQFPGTVKAEAGTSSSSQHENTGLFRWWQRKKAAKSAGTNRCCGFHIRCCSRCHASSRTGIHLLTHCQQSMVVSQLHACCSASTVSCAFGIIWSCSS